MQDLSEEDRAQKPKQKFEKSSAQTKVFDQWDEFVKEFFLAKVALEVGEIPLLGHYKDARSWLLSTSRRVIWINPDEQARELRNENIKSVGWSSGPEGWSRRDATSPPDTYVRVGSGKGGCKHYSPWLHLMDSSAKRHEVFLEPGEVLISVRNFLWQLSGGWNSWREETQGPAGNVPTRTGSDEYRKARLEFTFKKSLLEPKETRLFSNFDASIQEFLKSRLVLNSAELPAIAYYRDNDAWFLATSRRIVYPQPDGTHYMWYQKIVDLGWSEGPNAPEKCAHERVVYVDGSRLCKGCLSTGPWLFLLGFDGVRQEIAIEPCTSTQVSDCLSLMKRLELIHPREIGDP